MWEDNEWNTRIQNNGGKYEHASELRQATTHRLSLEWCAVSRITFMMSLSTIKWTWFCGQHIPTPERKFMTTKHTFWEFASIACYVENVDKDRQV